MPHSKMEALLPSMSSTTTATTGKGVVVVVVVVVGTSSEWGWRKFLLWIGWPAHAPRILLLLVEVRGVVWACRAAGVGRGGMGRVTRGRASFPKGVAMGWVG